MNNHLKAVLILIFNSFYLSFAAAAQNNNTLVKYVNPIIGTQKMGHTLCTDDWVYIFY